MNKLGFAPWYMPLMQSLELCGAVGVLICCYCMSNFTARPNFFLSNIGPDHCSLKPGEAVKWPCTLVHVVHNIYFNFNKLSLNLASRSRVSCLLHSMCQCGISSIYCWTELFYIIILNQDIPPADLNWLDGMNIHKWSCLIYL